MKKLPEILILLFFTTFLFWSCKQEKTQNIIDFQESVFYEIFPTVIDATYYDRRLTPLPPPPPDFLEKKGYNVKGNYKKAYEEWKNSDEFKKRKNKWKKKTDSIKRDTTSIFLAIPDTISRYEREDMYELIKHFKDQHLIIDSKDIDLEKGFRIRLNKLRTNNKKLKFKYLSEFPDRREFWRTKYSFYLDASINFTRILFDSKRSFGVFNVGIVHGRLDGYGCRVFIKKNKDGKWVIDKIEGTWVS